MFGRKIIRSDGGNVIECTSGARSVMSNEEND